MQRKEAHRSRRALRSLWIVRSERLIERHWLREDLSGIETPDIILVTSAMTYWYTGVQETIGMVREIFPKTPVVLGGVYATLCPDHARQHCGADEVLTGPAESVLLDLRFSTNVEQSLPLFPARMLFLMTTEAKL